MAKIADNARRAAAADDLLADLVDQVAELTERVGHLEEQAVGALGTNVGRRPAKKTTAAATADGE